MTFLRRILNISLTYKRTIKNSSTILLIVIEILIFKIFGFILVTKNWVRQRWFTNAREKPSCFCKSKRYTPIPLYVSLRILFWWCYLVLWCIFWYFFFLFFTFKVPKHYRTFGRAHQRFLMLVNFDFDWKLGEFPDKLNLN